MSYPDLWDIDAKTPPKGVFIGDLDGDGLPDVALPSGARGGFGRIYAGTISGFREKPEYVPPVAIARKDQQDRGVRFVDLDGDGLSDIVFRRDVTKEGKTEPVQGAFLNRDQRAHLNSYRTPSITVLIEGE